jgi:lysophospholipase L1-like esterase
MVVKHLVLFLSLAGMFVFPASQARPADAITLVDGDRVVLVGNTLIEREQRYGYWETALTRLHPDRKVIFRNLGWSGDTVFGHARAGFGSTAEGFKHLKEHVLALKPAVILVAYGTNESFDGPAGRPAFIQGLNVLLDTFAPTKARIVLLSPLRQEDLGKPLPSPAQQNKNLALYRDAIREVASTRKLPFIDLYNLLGENSSSTPAAHLTDNGIHLTAWGYWRSTFAIEQGLGLVEPRWRIDIRTGGRTPRAQGARLTVKQTMPLRFEVTDRILPRCPAPAGGPAHLASEEGDRTIRVQGLKPGAYTLTIDGKAVRTAGAAEWASGVVLDRGPEFDQVEQLRAAILAKNELYFHRWRPQNETYLFGFRKHEQGQNAREIPQFDPLVASQEDQIARLRVPTAHIYEIKEEKK